MFLAAKRRAHDVRGRDLEIGMAVDRIVDQQVSGEYLAEHAQAAGAARKRAARPAARSGKLPAGAAEPF